MHRLDNEIPAECTTMLEQLDIAIQLVPTHDHRRNLAEREQYKYAKSFNRRTEWN